MSLSQIESIKQPSTTGEESKLVLVEGKDKKVTRRFQKRGNSKKLPKKFYQKRLYLRTENLVNWIQTGLVSPQKVRNWAKRVVPSTTFSDVGQVVGQVLSSKTVKYRTLEPIQGGLFCDRIFGPVRNKCACEQPLKRHCLNPRFLKEKSKIKIFCKNCGLELRIPVARRHRLGYIELTSFVTHVWYLRGKTSYISILLGMRRKKVEQVAYCTQKVEVSETQKFEVTPLIGNLCATRNEQDLFQLPLYLQECFSTPDFHKMQSFVQRVRKKVLPYSKREKNVRFSDSSFLRSKKVKCKNLSDGKVSERNTKDGVFERKPLNYSSTQDNRNLKFLFHNREKPLLSKLSLCKTRLFKENCRESFLYKENTGKVGRITGLFLGSRGELKRFHKRTVSVKKPVTTGVVGGSLLSFDKKLKVGKGLVTTYFLETPPVKVSRFANSPIFKIDYYRRFDRFCETNSLQSHKVNGNKDLGVWKNNQEQPLFHDFYIGKVNERVKKKSRTHWFFNIQGFQGCTSLSEVANNRWFLGGFVLRKFKIDENFFSPSSRVNKHLLRLADNAGKHFQTLYPCSTETRSQVFIKQKNSHLSFLLRNKLLLRHPGTKISPRILRHPILRQPLCFFGFSTNCSWKILFKQRLMQNKIVEASKTLEIEKQIQIIRPSPDPKSDVSFKWGNGVMVAPNGGKATITPFCRATFNDFEEFPISKPNPKNLELAQLFLSILLINTPSFEQCISSQFREDRKIKTRLIDRFGNNVKLGSKDSCTLEPFTVVLKNNVLFKFTTKTCVKRVFFKKTALGFYTVNAKTSRNLSIKKFENQKVLLETFSKRKAGKKKKGKSKSNKRSLNNKNLLFVSKNKNLLFISKNKKSIRQRFKTKNLENTLEKGWGFLSNEHVSQVKHTILKGKKETIPYKLNKDIHRGFSLSQDPEGFLGNQTKTFGFKLYDKTTRFSFQFFKDFLRNSRYSKEQFKIDTEWKGFRGLRFFSVWKFLFFKRLQFLGSGSIFSNPSSFREEKRLSSGDWGPNSLKLTEKKAKLSIYNSISSAVNRQLKRDFEDSHTSLKVEDSRCKGVIFTTPRKTEISQDVNEFIASFLKKANTVRFLQSKNLSNTYKEVSKKQTKKTLQSCLNTQEVVFFRFHQSLQNDNQELDRIAGCYTSKGETAGKTVSSLRSKKLSVKKNFHPKLVQKKVLPLFHKLQTWFTVDLDKRDLRPYFVYYLEQTPQLEDVPIPSYVKLFFENQPTNLKGFEKPFFKLDEEPPLYRFLEPLENSKSYRYKARFNPITCQFKSFQSSKVSDPKINLRLLKPGFGFNDMVEFIGKPYLRLTRESNSTTDKGVQFFSDSLFESFLRSKKLSNKKLNKENDGSTFYQEKHENRGGFFSGEHKKTAYLLRKSLKNTGGMGIRQRVKLVNLAVLHGILQHKIEKLSTVIPKLQSSIPVLKNALLKCLGKTLRKLVKRALRRAKRKLRRSILRKYKNIRRLKLVRDFLKSKAPPEWMVLSVLPVLPPDLRPILQLEDDQVIVSDLNHLYQKIIQRNSLSPTNYDLSLLSQRMLQEGVDGLIENGKGLGKPICTESDRPLKSLAEILKGKKGRFRLNLLGKRVDYSGRSVIIVGPTLLLHQCGLPPEMAIELFQPFLIRKLLKQKKARTIFGAKQILKKQPACLLETLKGVMQNHPLLLNRAPTLHRLGFQAFQPQLRRGRAIHLHPLVCTAFNADFDGDQMGVHIPLSLEARAEAWKLMWSPNNLLSPTNGDPILVPTQDMVLGCYYLTTSAKLRNNSLKQETLRRNRQYTTLFLNKSTKSFVKFCETKIDRVERVHFGLSKSSLSTESSKIRDSFHKSSKKLTPEISLVGQLLFHKTLRGCSWLNQAFIKKIKGNNDVITKNGVMVALPPLGATITPVYTSIGNTVTIASQQKFHTKTSDKVVIKANLFYKVGLLQNQRKQGVTVLSLLILSKVLQRHRFLCRDGDMVALPPLSITPLTITNFRSVVKKKTRFSENKRSQTKHPTVSLFTSQGKNVQFCKDLRSNEVCQPRPLTLQKFTTVSKTSEKLDNRVFFGFALFDLFLVVPTLKMYLYNHWFKATPFFIRKFSDQSDGFLRSKKLKTEFAVSVSDRFLPCKELKLYKCPRHPGLTNQRRQNKEINNFGVYFSDFLTVTNAVLHNNLKVYEPIWYQQDKLPGCEKEKIKNIDFLITQNPQFLSNLPKTKQRTPVVQEKATRHLAVTSTVLNHQPALTGKTTFSLFFKTSFLLSNTKILLRGNKTLFSAEFLPMYVDEILYSTHNVYSKDSLISTEESLEELNQGFGKQGLESPLEVRVTAFGESNVIFPTLQCHKSFFGNTLREYLRTTSGRVLLNKVISSVF